MNVYLHELKANRKFAITWLLIMLSFVGIMVFMYIGISKDIDIFKKILSNYPENLRKAFGINVDLIGSALGYYSSFILMITLLCSSMQAMILGVSILSKEIREKTADFLYSKPISRSQIITSKLLASFTLLIASNIIFVVCLFFVLSSVSSVSFDLGIFILIALIPLFIQFIFFSLGIFISAIMSKIKAVLPISMGTVFGIYILSSFAGEELRVLLPFKYFDTKYILNNSKYELNYVILTFVIITILTALTYIIYKKKDIHSV
ncbi:MAG: ABC transporter permease subunit [Clostridia bacterium]|nr:ABC transporter permease subunit [Clostridia bacterium]MDD4387238.1 ABC transporter permease subunit [Clostridia bacterium]